MLLLSLEMKWGNMLLWNNDMQPKGVKFPDKLSNSHSQELYSMKLDPRMWFLSEFIQNIHNISNFSQLWAVRKLVIEKQ